VLAAIDPGSPEARSGRALPRGEKDRRRFSRPEGSNAPWRGTGSLLNEGGQLRQFPGRNQPDRFLLSRLAAGKEVLARAAREQEVAPHQEAAIGEAAATNAPPGALSDVSVEERPKLRLAPPQAQRALHFHEGERVRVRESSKETDDGGWL
jgi:hypothetical protein